MMISSTVVNTQSEGEEVLRATEPVTSSTPLGMRRQDTTIEWNTLAYELPMQCFHVV